MMHRVILILKMLSAHATYEYKDNQQLVITRRTAKARPSNTCTCTTNNLNLTYSLSMCNDFLIISCKQLLHI